MGRASYLFEFRWGESANITFLQSHMGANITKRPQPWVTNINTVDVHFGDFLALSKVRGC